MKQVESAISQRARRLMPWVLLVLYGGDLYMGWQHRLLLPYLFQNTFIILPSLKVLIALSVLSYFITAMTLMYRGRMTARYSTIFT